MLIRLFCLLLAFYFLIILAEMILFSFRCFRRKDSTNRLAFSKSAHYLCSTLTLIVVIALFFNLRDFDISLLWFYIIFGIAVFITVPLMFVVAFWEITWSNETLHYRNPLGRGKAYKIENIHLIQKDQYTTIMYQNRKVTDYSFMFLNIWNVIAFETFIEKNSSNKSQ